jgi:carboxymethylenebutenolidase
LPLAALGFAECLNHIQRPVIKQHFLAGVSLCLLVATLLWSSPSRAADTVSFRSGAEILHGLLYMPPGRGPFPAVLYNHGSAPGLLNNQAFARIAPIFVSHGWVFFAPYRRGQGLSSNAGPYIESQIDAARARGGLPLAVETMVRLLSTEQLQDQMAALAWLRQQPFVRPREIAAMGNSFGGIETVLGVQRGGYCAAVDASGGAESWNVSPGLRRLMLMAVTKSTTPIFFFQARNDYTTAPTHVLFTAMQAAGKKTEMHIYPAYGDTAGAGHSFAWRGERIWRGDVLQFVDRYCLAHRVDAAR